MDREEYFQKFFENTDNRDLKRKMRDAIELFENGNNHMYFSCLKVTSVDAASDVNFSSVTCKVEEMALKATEDLAPFGCFFKIGCKIIKEILSDELLIPVDENFQRALFCLLQFLSSDHSNLIRREEKESEAVIARRYAEHLLMPLVDEKTYVMDTYPGAMLVKCCDGEHPFKGKCGDTSFGLQDGWHGKVDILITSKDEEELPVFIGNSTEDNISVSSIEEESGEKFSGDSCAQMVAETIVFSFLQHKQNFGKLRNNLIPGLGISSGKLVVFMYDCEYDVLLGCRALDLFEEDVFVQHILFLWLVLNYKLFSTGLIDDFKNYRANFHRLLGDDNLERYRAEVTMPFHKKHSQKRTFDPNTCNIAKCLKRKLDSYPEVQMKKVSKK